MTKSMAALLRQAETEGTTVEKAKSRKKQQKRKTAKPRKKK